METAITASSFEDLKPEIKRHIRYLKACGKRKWFTRKKSESKKTGEVINRLKEICFELREPGNDRSLGGTHVLATYMVQERIGNSIVKIWDRLSELYDGAGKQGLQSYDNIADLTSLCLRMTNICKEFCEELVANGFIRISLPIIDFVTRFNMADDDNDHDDDDNLNNLTLSILHNCIRLSSKNRDAYRRANAVGVLKLCQKSASTSIQLKALMILAYVVNEKERKILGSSEEGLRVLLNILKNAVSTETHEASYEGYLYSAFEALDAINQLAINDTNKAEIEKQGAIPDIIHMLQDDCSDEERKVAAGTLWKLSFVESIRESEILQDTIPTLEKLLKSSNEELRGACAAALWEIKGRTPGRVSTSSASVEDSPPTYEEATADLEPSEAAPTQIMLSYQWDSKELVLKIKDRLEKAGYSVWIDIKDIEGDILGAMANAVKKSDVILMCLSERYQESTSCRSEATYAYKLKKKIIPLMLEPEYEPDGWLGVLQGMDLYYGFHSDEELEKNMPKLLKRIGGKNKSTEDSDTVDGPIQPQEQETCQALPPAQTEPRATSVDKWSKSDVQDWLRENDLDDISTNLARVKGKHLRKLNTQREQNEGSFKEEMKSDYYKIAGQSYLLFTEALEELFPKLEKRKSVDPSVDRGGRGNRNSSPAV